MKQVDTLGPGADGGREQESRVLPSWLEIPPASAPPPPVDTRPQLLPFGDLGWEDFERLCVRLAREEGDIEHCQLYGARGQQQQGIDLYSRGAHGRYSVYQCKRVKVFGPADIEATVTKFLSGSWADRAARFVLCVSETATSVARAEEIEKQRARLADAGVKFDVWDIEALSLRLKDKPPLVDDFFGRPWVERFCGTDAAKALGRRLDAATVGQFRIRLGTFYEQCFMQGDPGIPLAPGPGIPTVRLRDRYVLPDVLRSDESRYGSELRAADAARAGPEGTNVLQPAADIRTRPNGAGPARGARLRAREPLTAWLVGRNRCVLLGGPGSGKTSFLRFLALDLLSDEPRLAALAQQWGRHLPVWLPFAWWTQLVADDATGSSSIQDCLQRWFSKWAEADLWPLVEQAIGDERLLLLVDGLDEWTNETAGMVASQMLQVFLERHSAAAVVTSRPHGFAKVAVQGATWRPAEIAPLSLVQQEELIALWHAAKYRMDAAPEADLADIPDRARHAAAKLIEELGRSSDLSDLAKVPLLLSLLLYLHFQKAALPSGRFQAYDRLIEYLVRDHPARKRAAALLTGTPTGLTESEVRQVLGYLAFVTQRDARQGIIDEHEGKRLIQDYLTAEDGLGLSLPDARRYSEAFMNIAEGQLGLLVRLGTRELEFFPRVFQEFLAATHISGLDIDQQQTLVTTYGADPGWREVILALVWMTRRPQDTARFVDCIRAARSSAASEIDRLGADEALAEITFGDYRCPVALARGLAEDAARRVESAGWQPHRLRLLDHILDGLRSTKTRELVEGWLRRWAFSQERWRGSLYEAMAKWPASSETLDVLFRALHGETAENQRGAASSLALLAESRQDVGDLVRDIALHGEDALQRAAALEALCSGWPGHPRLSESIASARGSASPELRLAAIKCRVQRGETDPEDLQEVLKFARRWLSPGLDYGWAEEVPELLIQGWSGSADLKKILLAAVGYESRQQDLSDEIAGKVLIRGFPGDPEVAAACATHIVRDDDPFPFLRFEWKWLADSFRDDPRLIEAIDAWVAKGTDRLTELAEAAGVARTPLIKQKLIEHLRSDSSLLHWDVHALLEGWGMRDAAVAAALDELARGDTHRASDIAYLIPKIMLDQKEAQQRLLELLGGRGYRKVDFIILGLGAVTEQQDCDSVVDAILEAVQYDPERWEPKVIAEPIYALIQAFPKHRKVREIALRLLETREPPLALLAWKYQEDDEIRRQISMVAAPIPVALRARICEALSDAQVGDEFATKLLSAYDSEAEDTVKTLASIGYHRRLAREHTDLCPLVERLAKDTVALGPHMDERRRAAVAGLIVIGNIEPLRDENRIHRGSSDRAVVSLASVFEPNLPLIRLVLDHWKMLTATLGPHLPVRLRGRLSDEDDFWRNVCLAAAEFPEVHAEILSQLESSETLLQEPEVLGFLATIRPRSQFLLQASARAVQGGLGDSFHGIWKLLAAVRILVEHFGGDQRALDALLEDRRGGSYADGVIIALSLGWPDHELVSEAFQDLRTDGYYRRSPGAQFAITYARASATELVSRLPLHLDYGENGSAWIARLLEDPLKFRLRRDQPLAAEIFAVLRGSASPSMKATCPRMLALAGRMTAELREWALAELERQVRSGSADELGFDLAAGEVRPVKHSLLDLLAIP